jgi:NTE family protein
LGRRHLLNTPIEAVLDDKPRRDSVIFTVHMWNPEGPEPESIWQVLGRQKDIQYASRATSHIARQKQIHHLRHIIREIAKHVPEQARHAPAVKELAAWGCGTTMHVVRLVAPKQDGEDHTKDIDFTPAGIRARWQAGYADTRRVLDRAPWTQTVDPTDGVVIHDLAAAAHVRIAPVWTDSGEGPASRRVTRGKRVRLDFSERPTLMMCHRLKSRV